MDNERQAPSELGTAPINGLMVKYAVPCVISLVVSALYNIVDQLFIANASYLGSYGNAANTAVFPLTIVCLAIAGMFGDGTNAYYTFCVGSGRTKEGKNAVGSAVTVIAVTGIFFLLLYNIFSSQLLTAFGAGVNEGTWNNAKEYLFWISLGLPFYMLGQTLSPIICGDGSPRYAMVTMLTGCCINIIFDPVLIYVAGWGMKGAAVATIAGQIVVCILNLMYLRRMKNVRIDSAGVFLPRISALKQSVPLGLTSFFAQLSIVLSMAAVNNMLALYGGMDPVFSQEIYAQIPLAVVGLVFKFFQIIVSIAIGLAAGCVPIIGYNRGAGHHDRLTELFSKVIRAEATVGIVAFLVFELMARPITYLFGAANESIYYQDFAVTCIRLFLCTVILSCINKGVMIFLQGMGKAAQSTAISVLREIIGGVGFPILLAVILGFNGILFFMPAADILTFVLSLYFAVRLFRELKAAAAEDAAATGEHTAEPVAGYAAAEALTSCIITLGRSYGAGARTIGKKLASELQIPYYDAELLQEAAKASGLSRKFLESVDEKPVELNTLYQYAGLNAVQVIEGQAYAAQAEIIQRVADQGPCVIVGHRADQVLRGRNKLLSVFITASVESRIKRICQRDGLSEQESLKKILRVDDERAGYYNQHGDEAWGEAATYDLCIDTDRFGLDGTAEIIKAILPTL